LPFSFLVFFSVFMIDNINTINSLFLKRKSDLLLNEENLEKKLLTKINSTLL